MSEPNSSNPATALAIAGGLVSSACAGIYRHRRGIAIFAAVLSGAYGLYSHPPVANLERGSIGVRINQFSGATEAIGEGTAVVIPGVHELRRYSLREQVYRPAEAARADGSAPFQSVEGLSIGLDVSVRYALDPARIAALAHTQPDDISGQVVEPAVQSVLYKTLARYTVREIFSTKRQEIRETIEAELKALLDKDGIVLKQVLVGKVDLPADYRAGMEQLLAEELASEKMRYTLELKEKQVKESELEALAEKTRRETAAAAAGEEQIIAARAQAEAMKHVLPFKQKQIELRGLEAEAEKVARLKGAEANAEARQIEAQGEAESRRKLADAEVYRQERLGQVASEQLARDGALIQKNPLLIQKALADKLSDKVSVIIAPPPADGSFIGSNLVGRLPQAAPVADQATAALAEGE
ncbi:MAG: prohibitin family protein [Methylococcaceae bacterium]|nr:prohibitin family protein [Methylococcaceae bacterium]